MIDRSNGRGRCAYLKHLRLKVAEEHGIDYKPAECNHVGGCAGICPQCEKELRELTSIVSKVSISHNNCDKNLYFDDVVNEFVIS
jgi:ferredoxin